MTDLCKKEREALENARMQLSNHRANPLDWDTDSEEYQNTLSELVKNVEEKEKALRDCEASN